MIFFFLLYGMQCVCEAKAVGLLCVLCFSREFLEKKNEKMNSEENYEKRAMQAVRQPIAGKKKSSKMEMSVCAKEEKKDIDLNAYMKISQSTHTTYYTCITHLLLWK